MDAGVEDVTPFPEDILRTVAVMIVDVEDRDPRTTGVARGLGGDRGGVEVTIAAAIVAAGVMAGWAAECEGCAVARQHGMRGGERRLRAPVARGPAVTRDRCGRIERVCAEQGVDPRQVERAATDYRERVGNGIAATAGIRPQAGRVLEELDIPSVVDGEDRRFPVIVGLFGPADRSQDRLGPRRHFGISGEAAVVQFLSRGVGQLGGSEEAAHAGVCSLTWRGPRELWVGRGCKSAGVPATGRFPPEL